MLARDDGIMLLQPLQIPGATPNGDARSRHVKNILPSRTCAIANSPRAARGGLGGFHSFGQPPSFRQRTYPVRTSKDDAATQGIIFLIVRR
jgi:hypothetical protein